MAIVQTIAYALFSSYLTSLLTWIEELSLEGYNIL